jgi:GNAT superfamily N-acetyltransferase
MLAEAHEPVAGLTPQTLCACATQPAFVLPPQPVYIKPLTYKTAGDTQIAIGTTPAFVAQHVANWANSLMTKDEMATQLAQPHHALLWHPGGAHLLAALPPAGVADVLTLFTPEESRRKGHAVTLLTFLKSMAQKAGCSAITLEVRASNAAAIATYTRMGFVQVSVRKGYYATPVEDALVFSLNLS